MTSSGEDPAKFAARYGMTLAQLKSLNPGLTFGTIGEYIGGMRVHDCGILTVVDPDTGKPDPDYTGTITWEHSGQVDAATNRARFRNLAIDIGTGRGGGHRVSNGSGGIDCDNHGTGTGRTFAIGATAQFVRPWAPGQKITVLKTAGVGNETDPLCTSCGGEASIAGCSACGMKAIADLETIRAEQAAQKAQVGQSVEQPSGPAYGGGGWNRLRTTGYGGGSPRRLAPKD